MTYEIMKEIFASSNEFLKFERIQNKKSNYPDLHAFILLESLFPNSNSDMIAAAAHDEIWLQPNPDKLAELATEEQIIELIRCGVRLDTSTDSLAMFV